MHFSWHLLPVLARLSVRKLAAEDIKESSVEKGDSDPLPTYEELLAEGVFMCTMCILSPSHSRKVCLGGECSGETEGISSKEQHALLLSSSGIWAMLV